MNIQVEIKVYKEKVVPVHRWLFTYTSWDQSLKSKGRTGASGALYLYLYVVDLCGTIKSYILLNNWSFYKHWAPGSWSKLRLRSNIVYCLYVSWLKTRTKLKSYLSVLIITNFNRHIMINNQFKTDKNIEFKFWGQKTN